MAFHEPYFVKKICDGVRHDEFNKDVVFMVGDEQLSYHSQVLRSMFPLIRNLLPNPGTCPCEAFVPNFYHITITLDKVSAWTLSTLMSSLYNPAEPVYLSSEEMTNIKELFIMLGGDNNKCNFTPIQPSTINDLTEVDIILDKASESDNKSRVNKEEELLKDAEGVKNIQHSETVGEICIDEQADGSFSSTVPQEDSMPEELDESVDDEEITFSIDGSIGEIEIDDEVDNHLYKDNLDNVGIKHSELKDDVNICGLSANNMKDKLEECTKDVNTSGNGVAVYDGVTLKGISDDSGTQAVEKYSKSGIGTEVGPSRLEEEPLIGGKYIVDQPCTVDVDDGHQFQTRKDGKGKEQFEKEVADYLVANENKNNEAVGMGLVGSPEVKEAEIPETVRKQENLCSGSRTCLGDMATVSEDELEDEKKSELEDFSDSDKGLVAASEPKILSTDDEKCRSDVIDVTVDQAEILDHKISDGEPVLEDHLSSNESQLHDLQTLGDYEDDIEAVEDDIDEEFEYEEEDPGYLRGHTGRNNENGMDKDEASIEMVTKTLEVDDYVLNKDEENCTTEINNLGKKRKWSPTKEDYVDYSKREKFEKCPSPAPVLPLSVVTAALDKDESDSEESVELDPDLTSLSAPPEDVRRVKRDLSLSFEMEEDEEENVVDMQLFASKARVLKVKVDNGKSLITDILESKELLNIKDSSEIGMEEVDHPKGSRQDSVIQDNKSETLDNQTNNTEIQLFYNEENQSGQVEVGVKESSQEGTVTDVGNRTIMEQSKTVSVEVSVEINEKEHDIDADLITVGQAENNILNSISSKSNSNTNNGLESKDDKVVTDSEEDGSAIGIGEKKTTQESKNDSDTDDSNSNNLVCKNNADVKSGESDDDSVKEGELHSDKSTEEEARLEEQVSKGTNGVEEMVDFKADDLQDFDVCRKSKGSTNAEDSGEDSLSDASTVISDITADEELNESCSQEDTRESEDEMSPENICEKYEAVEDIALGTSMSHQLDVVKENIGNSPLRSSNEAVLGNCSNSKSKDHEDDTSRTTQVTEKVEECEFVKPPQSNLENVGNTCDEDESDLLTMDEDDIDMLNEQIESSIDQENIGPESVNYLIKQNTELEEDGASLNESKDPAVRSEILNESEKANSTPSPALSGIHDDGVCKDQGQYSSNIESFPPTDSSDIFESLEELDEPGQNENVGSTPQTDSYLVNGVSSLEELKESVSKENVVGTPRADSPESLENTVTGCLETSDCGLSNENDVAIGTSPTDSFESLENTGTGCLETADCGLSNEDGDDIGKSLTHSSTPQTDLSESFQSEVPGNGENTDEGLEDENARGSENADQIHEDYLEVSQTLESLEDNTTTKIRPLDEKQTVKRVTFAATASSLEDEHLETDKIKIIDTASNDKVVSDLYCTECPDEPIFKRGQLLVHLTDKHYSKKLLQLYPFTEGSCQLCVEANRARATVCKTKAAFAKHIGTVHEKVLELVPTHLKDAVLAIGKRRISVSNKEVESEDMETVGSRTQEMKESVPKSESITEKKEAIETTAPEVDDDEKNDGPVTEDPPQVISDGTRAEAKVISSGKCPFCPNSKTQFPRASLLNHLSSTHYNKQLLDAFPYKEGETCKLCVETGRQNPLVVKSKTRYITHMGSLHEKVIDLLPSEIRDALEVTKKVPVRASRRSSIANKEMLETSPPPPALPAQFQKRSVPPGPPSSRAPAPGPPMMTVPSPTTRTFPRTRTVSTVDEEDIPSSGKVTRGKTKETEKNVYLHKFSGVSISKID